MIRPVDSTSTVDPTAPSSTQGPADTSGRSFAELHTAALKTSGAGTSGAGHKITTPEGETWAPVDGDAHFARIITGPRTGQYINLTRGDRRGQTFSIEHRDGKTVHVYGSGSTEVVVESSKDKAAPSKKVSASTQKVASHDQPPKNETWAPVDGHSTYADILGGPRNGLYVNIAGGIRDGMAFQLVKHGDKVLHIYGTGKNRQVIEVGGHKKKPDTKTDSTSGSTSSTTGSSTSGSTSSTSGSTGTSGGTTAADTSTA